MKLMLKEVGRRKIDWVVCAAGNSVRFRERGFVRAKPLLQLAGVTMLERALSALELLPQDQVIIVTRAVDGVRQQLELSLRQRYPWVTVVFHELPSPTAGQLATVLAVKKHLRRDAGLGIWNCDTYFQSHQLLHHLRRCLDVDGIIPCAKATGASWSFVKSGTDGYVREIAEKRQISRSATVGLYFFTDNRTFLHYAPAVVARQKGKEAYVSYLYAELIERGLKFREVPCDVFLPFGTPEQVRRYWGLGLAELRAENPAGVLVVDLDGTLTRDDKRRTYAEKQPRRDVIRKLRQYREQGYRIIIHTARNMQTRGGDEALVIGHIGATTIDWLRRHKVPYDGLRFGKPFAREGFYLDDRALRPSEFLASDPQELFQRLEDEAK